MATKELTSENFQTTLTDNDIVIVDFWAAWCGPCRAFGPVFETVSERHPDVVFGKVDTEDQQALAGGFQITSIPTLLIVRENVVVYAQPGALPEQALENLITAARELDMDDVRRQIAEHESTTHAESSV